MKTQRIDIRMSVLDKTLIKVNAREAGLPMGQFMVDCAIHRKIKPPPSEDRLEVYKELSKFHRNFTQISNLIKNSDREGVFKAVQEVAEELKKHLEGIRNG